MNDRDAAAIVAEAWRRVHGRDPSALERTYAQAIARLETGYGRAGQFGAMAANGQFNWGAEQRRPGADGECPPGFAGGVDQGNVCFFVFPSDVEAAAAFLRTLTKTRWTGVVDAMRGSPEDVATSMRRPDPTKPYYAGVAGDESTKIRAYADGIRRNVQAIAQSVPTPTIPTGIGGGSSALAWILGIGLVGGAGYLYTREYGVPREITRAIAIARKAVLD